MTKLFAPSKDSESKVISWLQKSGAQNIESDGTNVNFLTTVGNANSMLNTKFKAYTNGKTTKLRTTGYSLPDDLHESVDLIDPTTYFGNTKAHAVLPRSGPTPVRSEPPTKRAFNKACETTLTFDNGKEVYPVIGPQCLMELYNTVGYKADPKSGSTIAFGNFLNESASYSDLKQFEKIYKIPSQSFKINALINGGVNNQNPQTEMDGEANLDVQNIIGLVDGLPVSAYITGGSPPFIPDLLSPTAADDTNEPYLPYYQYLNSQPNSKVPLVITNSYGDHENTVPVNYAHRVCNMIGMLGCRGRTILESSGDEGTGAVCRNNVPPHQPQFTPQFPGTCPYITAVGGTQFVTPEHAWNGSSGGFSFYFKQPWYQKQAVSTYLSDHISPATKKYYSSHNYTDFAGRGFPDISAHSLYPDYLTVINGTAQPNGGTSAASPVVAAIFALLNDVRLRNNMPSIGFANPWLYQSGYKGLNDIVAGGAVGCAGVDLQSGAPVKGAGIIPFASWNATPGWDPVTGLGTPNFGKLKALALGSYN